MPFYCDIILNLVPAIFVFSVVSKVNPMLQKIVLNEKLPDIFGAVIATGAALVVISMVWLPIYFVTMFSIEKLTGKFFVSKKYYY